MIFATIVVVLVMGSAGCRHIRLPVEHGVHDVHIDLGKAGLPYNDYSIKG